MLVNIPYMDPMGYRMLAQKKVLQIDHQETIQKQGDSSYLSDTHGIGFTPGMSKQPGTCW